MPSDDEHAPEPPAKKLKTGSADSEEEDEKKMKVLEKNDSGEQFLKLGAKKRLTVRTFKSMVLIDIREFYEKGEKMLPGKKGISLTLDQYKAVRESMVDGTIDAAIKNLQEDD
mmetsp:Transcript_32465/g.38804  ORF Transcript_32465/g.38804 Transcript_32465/m.38804 type:complete len:113 (-) Transcript_32465:169-507(-)